MSIHEYTRNTINYEEVFIAGKDGTISAEARKSMDDVRSQNNPVGVISGYYDEKLSIWCVSEYFLRMLNYDYESFMTDTDGSLYRIVVDGSQYPFSGDILEQMNDYRECYMFRKDGSAILVRLLKTDSMDDKGRRVWVLSVRANRLAHDVKDEAMDLLIHGMIKMIERFAICDLDNNSYNYHELKSDTLYPVTGSYMELLHQLSSHYNVLTSVEHVTLEKLLSIDNIRKMLVTENDIYKFEYCTADRTAYKVMSVMPIKWEGKHLSKVLLISQDVGQKHELENLANTDPLTGLYNERYLVSVLRMKEESRQQFALFYLDLDMFKSVNDTYGHDVGDQLLKAVANRLVRNIRNTDYAFRIGGDEFVLVLSENVTEALCETVMDRIKKAVSEPFGINGRKLRIKTSCGYAIYPDHEGDISKVRILADHKMYKDKQYHKMHTF